MDNESGRQARRVGRLLVAVVVVLAVSLTLGSSAQARAQTGGTWEQLAGVPGPVDRLFVPSSGALFAQVGGDLYRTDDGGGTWRTVTLPASGTNTSRRLILVDPTDHQQLYATGDGGLYRTVDDAASWQQIYATEPDFPEIAAFTVSPVDRGLIYVVVRTPRDQIIRFLRSQDGGQSWTMLEQDGHEFLACTWTIFLLHAHPTDPDRLFRSIDCHHGLTSSLLQESRDRGASWSVLVDAGGTRPELQQDPRGKPTPAPTPAPAPTPTGRVVLISDKDRAVGGLTILAGGQGGQPTGPTQFYAVVIKPAQGGGMSLLRTDDDGVTWIERLAYSGGGGMTPANDARPNVTLSSLAVDVGTPDRLYGSFREQVKGQPETSVVRTSNDGGQTWTDLGQGLPVPAASLALGIDGRNLYAATESGVWRLTLD
jgi:hypothetical protein